MKPHNKLEEPHINQSFGNWTVLEFGKWSNDKVYYKCQHLCGATRKFSSSELWNRNFKKCKKCESREIYRKNADSIILNSMYRQYKWSAKQRGYSFNLDKELFKSIIFSRCTYCNDLPKQERRITEKRRSVWHEGEILLVNGIDRVDNSMGYEPSNCVTCCSICNIAKSTMSVKEWDKMVRKWYKVLVGA